MLSFIPALCLLYCNSVDLTGKKYYSKPVKTGPTPGFEGAAQSGQLSFSEGRVTFILPRSDEKNAGTFTVKGDAVVIQDLQGKAHTFTIKDGGKVLIAGGDGEEYRRSDFPW